LAILVAGIWAWYVLEADESFKRKHGLHVNEEWHRYFIEIDATPVNKWENLPQCTSVVMRVDLTRLKII